MTTNNQTQIWVVRCRTNLQAFKKVRSALKKDDQLAFIRTQYQILDTVVKVAQGKARFQGISKPP